MNASTSRFSEGLAQVNGPIARSESAYQYLRSSLLEGPLAPGDKLSVVDLTHLLNCSRVPIMEALKRLEHEGFVDIVPQVGCRVVTPAITDVQDFFTLFATVESMVTRLAAERRKDSDVDAFKLLCAQIDRETEDAGGPRDNDPSYRRLNLRFHSAIHKMARSPVSTQTAASLWDRSDFYIKLGFGSLYFSKTVKRSHRQIRKAIANGNGEAAKRAIEEHLITVGEGVVRALNKQQTK